MTQAGRSRSSLFRHETKPGPRIYCRFPAFSIVGLDRVSNKGGTPCEVGPIANLTTENYVQNSVSPPGNYHQVGRGKLCKSPGDNTNQSITLRVPFVHSLELTSALSVTISYLSRLHSIPISSAQPLDTIQAELLNTENHRPPYDSKYPTPRYALPTACLGHWCPQITGNFPSFSTRLSEKGMLHGGKWQRSTHIHIIIHL